MRKDVPEETAPEARAELNGTFANCSFAGASDCPSSRAAFGTLRAFERKREHILLSIHRTIKKPG